jgi:hypothetical protein
MSTETPAGEAPAMPVAWTTLHIVFDGPPSHDAGRFVEVETPDGKSVNAGEWHERPDGFWELRLTAPSPPTEEAPAMPGVEAYKAENAEHGWTGRGFAFDGGCLNLDSKGNAEFVFDMDDCDPYYEEGKSLMLAKVPASEVEELRDQLVKAFPAAPVVVRNNPNTMKEPVAQWHPGVMRALSEKPIQTSDTAEPVSEDPEREAHDRLGELFAPGAAIPAEPDDVRGPGTDWGAALGLQTTVAMRSRIRELSERPAMDDHDRAVLMLLDDFARCMVLLGVMRAAIPAEPVAQWHPGVMRALSEKPIQTSDTKGLSAVLREWAGSYEEGSFDTESGLMIEAADRIDALEADAAAAWDKCEERRLEAVRVTDTLIAVKKALLLNDPRQLGPILRTIDAALAPAMPDPTPSEGEPVAWIGKRDLEFLRGGPCREATVFNYEEDYRVPLRALSASPSVEALIAERDELKAEEVEWKEAVQGEYNRAEYHKAKREALAAENAALKAALNDLISWFPDKPTEPEWRIKAGEYGADDAIAAARAALQKDTDNG